MSTVIFVRSLSGPTLSISVHWSETIFQIKEKISMEIGICASKQQLIFNNRKLENTTNFAENGLQGGATLFVVTVDQLNQSKNKCAC